MATSLNYYSTKITSKNPRELIEQYMLSESDDISKTVGNIIDGYPFKNIVWFDSITLIIQKKD